VAPQTSQSHQHLPLQKKLFFVNKQKISTPRASTSSGQVGHKGGTPNNRTLMMRDLLTDEGSRKICCIDRSIKLHRFDQQPAINKTNPCHERKAQRDNSSSLKIPPVFQDQIPLILEIPALLWIRSRPKLRTLRRKYFGSEREMRGSLIITIKNITAGLPQTAG
jgi:hypothetical protein